MHKPCSPENYWPEATVKVLKRQHYALFAHAAVKLCHYTKSSLTAKRECYKARFYGIRSHRCLQMTPLATYCNQDCVFCWRSHLPAKSSASFDFPPAEMVDSAIAMQRKLLSGYGALREQIGDERLREALNPVHAAISLSGEPTFYPQIGELIDEFRSRNFTTFLVTNGLAPETLESISMPSQLYLSLEAVDEGMHRKINKPLVKNSWQLLNKSIDLLPQLKTRRVIRLTCVKHWNMCNEEEFAQLIARAEPHFVEVKGYMFVGASRKRLKMENMPLHSEVRGFAEKINNYLHYNLLDESKDSRVVLLSSGEVKAKLVLGE